MKEWFKKTFDPPPWKPGPVFFRPRRPAGHKEIDELHCWIITRDDGREEIVLNTGGGRAGSAFSVRREGVLATETDLRKLQEESLTTDNPIKAFRLASFVPVREYLP